MVASAGNNICNFPCENGLFLTFPRLSSLRRRIYAAGRERSGVEIREHVLANVKWERESVRQEVNATCGSHFVIPSLVLWSFSSAIRTFGMLTLLNLPSEFKTEFRTWLNSWNLIRKRKIEPAGNLIF